MSAVARTTFLPIVLSATFLCRLMGKANTLQTDDVTLRPWPLTFDLWGSRTYQWCGLSYSINTPSLKFLGLPVPKIWLIFGNGVNWPGDIDLWPFDLWLRVTRVMRFFPMPISFFCALPFRLRVRNGQTDRQTDGQRPWINYAPPYGGGDIITQQTAVLTVSKCSSNVERTLWAYSQARSTCTPYPPCSIPSSIHHSSNTRSVRIRELTYLSHISCWTILPPLHDIVLQWYLYRADFKKTKFYCVKF